MMRKLTKEEFIKKAKQIHGNKYDYSKVKYKNNSTKVCIICPTHGEFWQTPSNHLARKGCLYCGILAGAKAKELTKEEYIEKVKIIHDNFYDYSKIEYLPNDVKITVGCPKHGEFKVSSYKHLHNKQGCPECSIEKLRKNLGKTKEIFITQSNAVHSNKYDYSKVEYINDRTPVCIICPKHGEFWQIPSNHIHKTHPRGCPECKQSYPEQLIANYLKNNNIEYVYEKKFDWLKKQTIDFFLPMYNIGIEYQGEQHFKPVNFKGKLSSEEMDKIFLKIKKYDKNKLRLCEEYNLSLFYINYNEDIILKLKNILDNTKESINK